jgi:ABC-type uncharacterized transport system permease subunit
MTIASPLHAQVLNAINSIRPYLYGSGFTVLMLKFNGVDKQFDELVTLATDFIIAFDRTGNLTVMLSTDEFATEMRDSTHVVFDGWLYQLTEPAKPEQGPFPMWKAVGRPMGSKYIVG